MYTPSYSFLKVSRDVVYVGKSERKKVRGNVSRTEGSVEGSHASVDLNSGVFSGLRDEVCVLYHNMVNAV